MSPAGTQGDRRSGRQAGQTSGRPGGQVLSATGAAAIIARLAFKRLFRGRVLWASLILALLPGLAVVVFSNDPPSRRLWRDTFTLLIGVMAIIMPLYLAAAVSEETEERTFTYLWCRPFPRWSMLAGKLAALAPLAAAILAGGVALAFVLAFGTRTGQYSDMFGRSVLAIVLGALAAGTFCTAVATLLPRHATAVSLAYLMAIDTAVAVMPFAIQNLTISHHVREMALEGPVTGHALWLLGMAVFWLILAVSRITRAEYGGTE